MSLSYSWILARSSFFDPTYRGLTSFLNRSSFSYINRRVSNPLVVVKVRNGTIQVDDEMPEMQDMEIQKEVREVRVMMMTTTIVDR